MKKILTFFGLLLAGAIVSAQSNVIDKYFNDLQEVDHVTKVNVQEKTFDLFTEIEIKDAKEAQLVESIKKLDGIKGIFQEQAADALDQFNQGYKAVLADGEYEELMSLSTADEKGMVMIREEDDTVREMMVMYGATNEFGVFTIFGDIDIKAVADLGDVIRENGKAWFDVFENVAADAIVFDPNARIDPAKKPRLKSNDAFDFSIYPNPAVDHVILESKSGKNESYQLSFYTLIGEEVLSLDKVQLPYRLNMNEIPSGSYFIRITDNEGTFKNFKIVKPK